MDLSKENGLVLEGVVENVIYASDAGDYSVFVLRFDGKAQNEEVVCTARGPANVGEDVKLVGGFFVHPTYGQQFRVDVMERLMPQTEDGMEKYLASGIIKGIGAKRAKMIMDEFGISAFDVMENKPELLAGIKGISRRVALEIGEEFAEKSAQRNTMMYLQGLGLTAGQSDKIYKKYGANAIGIIKTNPYILAEDIFGIGFKIADGIGAKTGIAFDSPFRISAGVKHVLAEGLGDGHVYLPKAVLAGQAAAVLGVEAAEIENHLIKMQVEREIKQDKIIEGEKEEIAIYLSSYYHAEIYTARRLLELNAAAGDAGQTVDLGKSIEEAEGECGIVLAKLQKVAVEEALANGVSVITGGPGTGKTTTINTIIRILDKMEQKIVLCAPTGRAAKRMSEATGMPASTIHRLLGIFSAQDRVLPKDELPDDMMIWADCVIVDESSMVDIMLMFRLLKSIRAGTRLILVGDVNQLPSVGAGNVLRDIINSGRVKVVYLDEIFRQGRQSAIVMNAHRINQGIYPVLNEKESDFFFMKEADIGHVAAAIADLASRRLPKFMGVDRLKDIQVLTPQRKSVIGVENLNILLQNVLNPPSPFKKEKPMGGFCFREGDKVMQIKNNYGLVWRVEEAGGGILEEDCGIFNGDEGVVLEIDNASRLMRVAFDEGRLVDYEFSQLDELVLSYAITIHKSQGSEYDIVIMPIHSGPPMLLNRNLLYTAITRAKKLVVIVGRAEALNRMVDNVRESVRYSTLKYRMERFLDIWTRDLD